MWNSFTFFYHDCGAWMQWAVPSVFLSTMKGRPLPIHLYELCSYTVHHTTISLFNSSESAFLFTCVLSHLSTLDSNHIAPCETTMSLLIYKRITLLFDSDVATMLLMNTFFSFTLVPSQNLWNIRSPKYSLADMAKVICGEEYPYLFVRLGIP